MSKVYEAINAVQAVLAKEGITKDRKNLQQNYAFRGIDDVYNALSPLLAEHKLCILPRMLNHILVERTSNSGGALFNVTVEAEFDFVSAEDDTVHTVKMFGEAMDSGDKATNKAMSAAYKYCCLQVFAIPTEGDNDADLTTHAVKAPAAPPPKAPGYTESLITTRPKNFKPSITGAQLGLAIMNYTHNDAPAAKLILQDLCGKTTCAGMKSEEAVSVYKLFEERYLSRQPGDDDNIPDSWPPPDELAKALRPDK